MFLINRQTNGLQELPVASFKTLGFRERQDLQEWLAAHPKALGGEDLLIIQKEFAGFSDTHERLDLLALDKKGNLVIIENKLDDSGRDVTWQALKYASYCSTLTKDNIRDMYQDYLNAQGNGEKAVERLSEFFDGTDYSELVLNPQLSQRIILVAGHFRKEVTSTVLWLLSRKIGIQCFKATVYTLDEQCFLTIDQIIPTQDAQEYVIGMAAKVEEDMVVEEETKNRHRVRLEFWPEVLKRIRAKSPVLFQSISPTKDHWLSWAGAGIQSVTYQFVVTMNSASVQLNIARSKKAENKMLFAELLKSRATIEQVFGCPLTWDEMPDFKSSKIYFSQPGFNYFNRDEWPQIANWLTEHMVRLEAAFREPLQLAKPVLSMAMDEGEMEPVEVNENVLPMV